MDIHDLLRASEGKTLEFKRNLDSPQSVLRVLVAFANTAGGTLLIGVEDRTRAVCGVAEPLALEERLASLIADSIKGDKLDGASAVVVEALAPSRGEVVAIQMPDNFGA